MAHAKEALDHCVESAAGALASRRGRDGLWEGRLSSSPLATAAALCALAGDEADAAADCDRARNYLRRTQRPEGGWGDTDLDRANLAATLLVLSAEAVLRRGAEAGSAGRSHTVEETGAGGILDEEQRRRAEEFVRREGGPVDGLRRIYGDDLTFQVPLRTAAAFAGLLAWREVEPLPFELVALPRRLWRILRLPVVGYALPALACVGQARHARAPSRFRLLRWLRSAVSGRVLETALRMQPQSGGYLEAVPLTAFCLLSLKAAGRGEHPVARNARRFLSCTQREDGSWPVEVNLSVWNTTRAVEALYTAGLLDKVLNKAERDTTRERLLSLQTRTPSPYSGACPGGWGWNHLPGSVPDADDTSGAVLALRALGLRPEHPAFTAAAKWLSVLQNRDGGWPTFCRGWNRFPFDRSAPDLTAHALRALAATGRSASPTCVAGRRYLARVERPDGSFAPLWFGCEAAAAEADGGRPNLTYGTAHVLFSCTGVKSRAAAVVREKAVRWLKKSAGADGGFGGRPGAPGTVEDTGLALRALVESGAPPNDEICRRAATWLSERQRPDGSWDAAPVGFYFAVLWYCEELYPLCFALSGLGAWRRRLRGEDVPSDNGVSTASTFQGRLPV